MKLFPIILTIAIFVVLAFYSYYRFTQEENAFFRIINEDGTRTLILLLAGTIGWYFFLTRKTDNRFARFLWPHREEEMRHKAVKLFPIILTIAIFVVLAFYSYYTLTQEENAFLRIINEDGTRTLILLLAGTIGWYFFLTRKTDNRFAGFLWPHREEEMRHKAVKLFPIILTIAIFVVLAFYSYYTLTQEENAFLRIINEDGTHTLILLLAGTIGCYFFLARKTDSRFSGFHWPLREEEKRHKEVKLFPVILTIAIFVVLAFYSYYTLTQEENAFLRIINEDGTHTLILLLTGTIGWYFFLTRKTDNRFAEFLWPFRKKEMRHKVMKPFLIFLTIVAFVIIALYLYYMFIQGENQEENALLRIINEEGTRTLILLLVGIIGWYFLLARTEAAQQSANAANENVKIAEQGLTVERLTRATEQLGRSNLSVRVGGILSLEQVAIVEKDESEVGKDERETITRILVSFIRTRAKKCLQISN